MIELSAAARARRRRVYWAAYLAGLLAAEAARQAWLILKLILGADGDDEPGPLHPE